MFKLDNCSAIHCVVVVFVIIVTLQVGRVGKFLRLACTKGTDFLCSAAELMIFLIFSKFYNRLK
jgi:hypothetical protein